MAERGVHFAINPDQARKILAAKTDRALMALIDAIEEAWEENFVVESDKAWNAIHRCLTDGTLLYDSGKYPLNHCICGGQQLHRGPDYTAAYVSPEQVKDVADSLKSVTKSWMRKQYDQIDPSDYAEVEMDDDDFEYVWENFVAIRDFYRTAADASRAVLFTVDC